MDSTTLLFVLYAAVPVVFLLLIVLSRRAKRHGGTLRAGVVGAVYGWQNRDKQKALEIIVEGKAAERRPEYPDGGSPPDTVLIRRSVESDAAAILAIVNDAAQAYRGVIPVDRWHDPYMSADELETEIAGGVVFWVAEEDGRLSGVMGIQDKGEVALVRHAYVASTMQKKGVGTRLLRHVEGLVDKPILIGTWASASWAIEFYRRNGFTVVPNGDKNRLLRTYWSIPERQIETSVVLADGRWREARDRAGAEG